MKCPISYSYRKRIARQKWTSKQGRIITTSKMESCRSEWMPRGRKSNHSHSATTQQTHPGPPCDVLYTSEKRPICLDFPLPRGQARNRGGRCIKGGHTNFWHCSDARNWQAALLPSLLAPRCQGCQTLECRGVDEKGAPRPWMQHQANPGIRISAISGRCFRLCRSFPR